MNRKSAELGDGVMREWLKPFALGVATASIASVGAWLYTQYADDHELLVLTYVKGEGLNQPKLPPDPAPQYRLQSDYVIRIARRCGIKSWTIQSGFDLDATVEARLEIPLGDVSVKMFNCLTRFVTPKRVMLEMKHAAKSG